MDRIETTPQFSLLLLLAQMRALHKPVKASTKSIARKLGVSQQTVSRWLIGLSRDGLVERQYNSLSLTSKAKSILAEMKNSLSESLREDGELSLRGSVVSGMQEGRYYLSLPDYVRQIEEAVSFRPFPGTLNVKLLDSKSVEAKQGLSGLQGRRIAGFRKGGKVFGPARLFLARITSARSRTGESSCAVILPDYTHYGSGMLEVIAPESLRRKLGLRNGSEVRVYVNP